MNVFFEGCCHGELDKIYERVASYYLPVDLLLIGGDFQAIRNERDLLAMNVPPKYRHMHDFHKYYSGECVAPFLTIIIGGNHESSAYMRELYHGGWLAPNIYYLGAAGVVNYKGLRIGGISGIYNERSYRTGHHEQPPYDPSTIRSVYHVRAHDVMKVSLVSNGVDIFLSHDWPAGIEQFGDTKKLLQRKKHFQADIQSGSLGSPPAMHLLHHLKPKQWLSAHLHCKFVAAVDHKLEESTDDVVCVKNPDEIVLDELDVSQEVNDGEIDINGDVNQEIDISEELNQEIDITEEVNQEIDISEELNQEINITDELDDTSEPNGPPVKPPSRHRRFAKTTNFLALDKCLPKRSFVERLNIDHEPTSEGLQYDPEWLSIIRCTNHLFTKTHGMHPSHPNSLEERQALQKMVESDYAWVKQNIIDKGKLDIPNNFVKTAEIYTGADISTVSQQKQLPKYTNPQTVEFLDLLQIPNRL